PPCPTRRSSDLGDERHEALLELGPEAAGDVHAAGRRALLSLELETATDDGGGDRVQIALGRRVDEDEVLAAGLADEARVLLVVLDVLADAAPERLEGAGGAGEVDAAQVGAGQCGVAD